MRTVVRVAADRNAAYWAIMVKRFSTGETREAAKLDFVPNWELAVSPDERYAIVTRLDTRGTELFLFRDSVEYQRSRSDDFARRAALPTGAHRFVYHYHHERNHQGLGNELIDGMIDGGPRTDRRRPRVRGLLNFYARAA